MTTITQTKISELAQVHLDNSQFITNTYFTALVDGRMTLEEFRDSQAQFYHAVKFFARPMSLIISRIPDPKTRLTILHNIVEEHGEFEPSQFHEATFRNFLGTIGKDEPPVNPGSAVDAFNCLLSGVCSQESITTAISCIGMIELAFAGASALIGNLVVERGWVDNSQLVHYKLHAELDMRHAAEFFEIIEEDPHFDIAEVERGLGLGIYAFKRLYEDLVRTE